ncbi:MAG: adenosine-specific kinase [Conexivisphaera sp.]|jgi:adenosine/AMP kinase|nr:MAG: adenosine monophosphate-protein transferase [Nitrososphaera sp.]
MLKEEVVPVEVPGGFNVIVGQAHFIKTVEDLYEALATSFPGAKFGLAFCESSGKALVRYDGNDERSTQLAIDAAMRIGAGHCFVVYLNGSYPINVLDRIKDVQEVACVYAATGNPLKVVVADDGEGRGILGVIDGVRPRGIEGEEDREERRRFLRNISYKR